MTISKELQKKYCVGMHEDLELEKKNNSENLNAGNISSFVKDKWYVICVRMKSWFLFIFC